MSDEAEFEVVKEAGLPALLEAGLAEQIARAEIDVLISTARAYPRSVTKARQRMLEYATLDEPAAEECNYALPRGNKVIEGPSIRFAELAAQSWGNLRVASRITAVDRKEKYVEAEAVFLDAETNNAQVARVRRRISDSRGRIYSDDMIIQTGNAAQSIARRNAILAGIPKSVWRAAYEAARKTVMGDFKTLATRRANAIKEFLRFGLKPEQVFALLGVKGEEDIDLEKMIPLRGMYTAILNNETTVEELLRGAQPAQHAIVANPLADEAPTAEKEKRS